MSKINIFYLYTTHLIVMIKIRSPFSDSVLQPLLPSVFSGEDSSQLIQKITDKKKDISVYCDSIVATHSFVNKCRAPFDDVMRLKAKTVICSKLFLFSCTIFSTLTAHAGLDIIMIISFAENGSARTEMLGFTLVSMPSCPHLRISFFGFG